MATFVLTTAALLGILWIDLRPHWQEKHGKVFSVSLTFLLLGYVILVLVGFGIQVPSPVQLLGRLLGVL